MGIYTPLQKNKEIVDSRLRPQWCFHLGNVTEMEEMLDCKLDALIWSFAWENKWFSCQHKSARITWPLTFDLNLDLEHTLDACWPGVHRVHVWWRSGHLPARSDGQCKFSTSVHCTVTKWQTAVMLILVLVLVLASPVLESPWLTIWNWKSLVVRTHPVHQQSSHCFYYVAAKPSLSFCLSVTLRC